MMLMITICVATAGCSASCMTNYDLIKYGPWTLNFNLIFQMDLTCDEYMPSEEDFESWDRVSDDAVEGECDVTERDDSDVIDDVIIDDAALGDDATVECSHCGKHMLDTECGDVCFSCMEPPYLESSNPYSEFFDSDVCDDYIAFNILNSSCE